ncbi:MAG: RNA-guided endonuclease InsQ/TnpB family protein, partial [Solirubrobacteraceae bacterium]
MKVRYTYRARVTPANEQRLLAEWDAARWVWNRCVELDSKSRRAGVVRPQAGDLDRLLTRWRGEHQWLRACSQNVQQQTVRDFCNARSDAWAIRKRGGRRGDPRFRSRRLSTPTLNVTRSGPFRLRNEKLLLPHGIVLRPVWSRDLPSEPSSVRISQDRLGRWFVSFVVEREIEPLPETGRAIGIDFGLKDVATTSAGPEFDLPHDHHGDRAARALLRYERQMARRRRPKGQAASNGYRQAKRRVARAKRKVADQRQDQARKWAVRLVREFDQIAAEDLSVAFMLKNRSLARTAADARIGSAKAALSDAATKHG